MPGSLIYPDLVVRYQIPVPSLEVGIDFLPERLEEGWMEEVEEFTRLFVERSGFQKAATIWNWCGMSVNLCRAGRPPGRSMFHVAFGLPSAFLSQLEHHLQRRLGVENVRIAEHVAVGHDDGWMPVCHVEQGKAWTRLDDEEWAVILPRSPSGRVAYDSDMLQRPDDTDEGSELEGEPPATTLPAVADSRSAEAKTSEEADLACEVRALFGDATPRPKDQAVRDLAYSLGYGRVGSKIRRRMTEALESALNRGILTDSTEGLALNHRSIQGYDEDSLKVQFIASLQGHDWVDTEAATRMFARWLGFTRTGHMITGTTQSVVKALVREGKLEKRGQKIRQVA
jgi:hypothetical protein